MPTVLLIEDNEDTASLVLRTLLNEFEIAIARTLSEAKLILTYKMFDLILLDVDLPDGNGFDFFQTLQNESFRTPVIILTGIDDSQAKARGFDLGVDDYIVKPFCRVEFKARVNRRIKKVQSEPIQSGLVNLGRLTIDKDTQRAMVKGQVVELTSIEFKILMVLVKSANEAIEREEIVKTVWPNDAANLRAIDTHVSKLRKKIGSDLIESVHGVGYRLAV